MPKKCNLRTEETTRIAIDFFEVNHYQLLEWADESLLPYLLINIQDDGFYKEEQNKYYFPLFTIREEYIRGSMWIEVTCEGVATFGQYFEEV